jgi:hypothetical protein
MDKPIGQRIREISALLNFSIIQKRFTTVIMSMSNNRVVTGKRGFFMCSKMFSSFCNESMGDDRNMEVTQRLPHDLFSLDHITFGNVEVLAGPGNMVLSRRTNFIGISHC